MNISVDTNVLVRSVVRDDPKQAALADEALTRAARISVSLPCLCEFVWVLRRVYAFDSATISLAIRTLMDTENVIMNRPAIELGLQMLEAGGDFADGIIAHESARSGGDTFVSFDRKAVALLSGLNISARLLSVQA